MGQATSNKLIISEETEHLRGGRGKLKSGIIQIKSDKTKVTRGLTKQKDETIHSY